MGLLARIKLLSCTTVYRIRVLGNNCSLKCCFKSWRTTVNSTLGLVFFVQKSLPHMTTMCSLKRKQCSKCLSARLNFFPAVQGQGEGATALKSNLAGTNSINPLQRCSRAIQSASSHDSKNSTTKPKYRHLF